MDSVAAAPETALGLIAKARDLCARAMELNGRAIELNRLALDAAAGPGLEALAAELACNGAALSNNTDELAETGAVLRAKEVPAGGFAKARSAGEAGGYMRGLEEGRRQAQGRRSGLALVPRAG